MDQLDKKHPPAVRAGGRRVKNPEGRSHDQEAEEDAVPVANATQALQGDATPANLALTAVDATALNQASKPTLAELVGNPKAVASTYHPPEPKHEKHVNHNHHAVAQHIQQPDRNKK